MCETYAVLQPFKHTNTSVVLVIQIRKNSRKREELELFIKREFFLHKDQLRCVNVNVKSYTYS